MSQDTNTPDEANEENAPESGNWTRRDFLTRVGYAGGAAALYETMIAMGLINVPPAWAGSPQLAQDSGKGKSVVILGAGIGGLTTALLLARAGYSCKILEALPRAGGRNHTARRGGTVTEDGEQGRTVQTCEFDEGLYMNLGPGRLPYHHRRVLGYCKELKVALEPYIMNTTGNLFQSDKSPDSFGMKPVVYRQVQNDSRGYIAEMLAKVIDAGLLDKRLDGRDKKMLSLLRMFGPLGTKGNHGEEDGGPYNYNGSTRVGCAPDPDGNPTPNVYHNCELPKKMSLNQLLDSKFWEDSFYDPIEFEWQPTLFQPTGGMDKIVEGFLNFEIPDGINKGTVLGDLITYSAPVTKVEVHADSVTVAYQGGTVNADYCVSNIPCPVLSKIANNFSEDPTFKAAVDGTKFESSCKVGWQANTRFWESNDYEIYGGISWTNDIIEQIWYPSNDFFTEKGTLTGAYIHDNPGKKVFNATKFGKLPLKERLAKAKAGGFKLHPEFHDEKIVPTQLGMSIAWQNVPYAGGAWPSWSDQAAEDVSMTTKEHQDHQDYRRLLMPFNKRFFVVGDQASTLPGWQEGAMMSAEHVVELLAGLKPHEVPEGTRAPDTFKVIQGHG